MALLQRSMALNFMKYFLAFIIFLTGLSANSVQFQAFTNANTVFVDSNGSDSGFNIGIKGVPERPFKTIQGANTVATVGNWVIVTGATIATNNILKNGVNYEIYPDIVYCEAVTNSPGYGIIDDRGCGATTNIVICHGNLYYCSGTNGVLSFGNFTGNFNAAGTIVTTNVNTELHFKGNNIYTSHFIATTLPAWCIEACKTNTTLECNNMFTWMPSVTLNDTAFGPTVLNSSDTGIKYNTNGYIATVHGYVSPNGTYSLVSTAQDPSLAVDMFVNVGKMTRKFYGLWNSPNYRTWLTVDVIDNSTGEGAGVITLEGSQKTYITAKKIAGGVDIEPVISVLPLGGTSNTEVWIKSDKLEAVGTAKAYVDIECGLVDINIATYTNSSGTVTNGITISGGSDVNIHDGKMFLTMTGAKGVVYTGGTAEIRNMDITYNGTATTNANPVFVSASGLRIKSSTLAGPAIAQSIAAPSAVNVGAYWSAGVNTNGTQVTLSPNAGFTQDLNAK